MLYMGYLDSFFVFVFSKYSSFKVAGSGQVGVGRAGSSQVNLLVNLFFQSYVIFILQWIAFIFGRGEEKDQ